MSLSPSSALERSNSLTKLAKKTLTHPTQLESNNPNGNSKSHGVRSNDTEDYSKGPQQKFPLYDVNISTNLLDKGPENKKLKIDGSDVNKLEHTSMEKRSQEDSTDHEKQSCEIGNVPSTMSPNMVWDGSLQLNASMTVSAMALFKSGEKASKVKWPELVEVKGKVRLDAFEKYIQELPRSRNRALMVTSLCCKPCSSKTGLKGMNEAARSYKNGGRVGLAELSPGVMLYVCPRTDAIITILAKYGFFKGKAVLENDQDSLIGCVVWRKNLCPSTSLSKKCQKEESQSVAGKSLKSLPDSGVVIADLKPTSLERAKQNDQCGNMNDPTKVDNSDAYVSSVPPPLALGKSQINMVELQPASRPDSSLKDSNELLLKGEISAKFEKSSTGLWHFDPALPPPSQHVPGSPHRIRSADDDDLPEFDFKTACGVFPCLTNEFGQVTAAPHFHDRSLNQNVPIPHVLPFGKPIAVHSTQLIYPSAFEGSAIRPRADPHISQKHIWDDDDNMPEWNPPNWNSAASLPSAMAYGHCSQLLPLVSESAQSRPLMPRQSKLHVNPALQTMQTRPPAVSINLDKAQASGSITSSLPVRPGFSMFNTGPFNEWRGRRS